MDPIPDEVRRFLDENVESIDQLEILRILSETPDKEWLARDLARMTQTPPETAAASLTALHARGLLALETRGDLLLARRGARTPGLEAQVDRLLQLYRERPVTMIKLVYARANERLRAFADAFKIRKEG